ncbi:hypothetical protein EXN66_Car008209 [Channa argus]|uniref:Uncharacterized protein n=1 Tax=Channa argus TaxID=215402 RepID=A0A6G1PQS5_CHAAH|nr:hypothetical protein EXN66_Car008209 [Channa argus]
MDLIWNHPLSRSNITSTSESVLSLYHSLITGTKDLPVISCERPFITSVIITPFPYNQQNTRPSMLQPASVVMPTGGSRSAPQTIWTPVHPEKLELRALKANCRKCLRDMEVYSSSFTGVISAVYRSEGSELDNYWRVTDYSADEHIVMSVLCRFNRKVAHFAATDSREDDRQRRGEQQQQQQNFASTQDALETAMG